MVGSKELRPGGTTRVDAGITGGSASTTAGSGGVPGKRALTDAIPPAPTGAPRAPDANREPGSGDTRPDAGPPPLRDTPKTPPEMVAFIVEARGQKVQIYLSPGGISLRPNVFMFFHGHHANLMIDPAVDRKTADNVSGNDTAAAAMQEARAPDTIVMLPQGIRGDDSNDGGRMPGLQPRNRKEREDRNTLPLFIDEILARVSAHLVMTGKIEPRHIALAAHSGGGYKGLQDALNGDGGTGPGGYRDTITDITLMDTSYEDGHFKATRDWLLGGSPGKTVRIVQSQHQITPPARKDPDHPEAPATRKPKYYLKHFSEAALEDAATKKGMSIVPIHSFPRDMDQARKDPTRDRGNKTFVVQHTHVVTPDHKVQGDVLILESDLGHHEVRDNVMDDAINSIGQGPKSALDFGKNHMPGYGRDPAMPHADNEEPTPAAPQPKHP